MTANGIIIRARYTGTMSQASQIAQSEIVSEMPVIGARLIRGIRERMRRDTGDEQQSVNAVVTASNARISTSVRSSKVQAIIDEEGREADKAQPPSRRGSRLYAWVLRKGFLGATSIKTGKRTFRFTKRGYALLRDTATGKLSIKVPLTPSQTAYRRAERIAYGIALSIKRRGLPRPGDPLRAPFLRTFEAERAWMISRVFAARDRIVARLNA